MGAALGAAAQRSTSASQPCWRLGGLPLPWWPPCTECGPTTPACRNTAPAPPCGPWPGRRRRCGCEPATCRLSLAACHLCGNSIGEWAGEGLSRKRVAPGSGVRTRIHGMLQLPWSQAVTLRPQPSTASRRPLTSCVLTARPRRLSALVALADRRACRRLSETELTGKRNVDACQLAVARQAACTEPTHRGAGRACSSGEASGAAQAGQSGARQARQLSPSSGLQPAGRHKGCKQPALQRCSTPWSSGQGQSSRVAPHLPPGSLPGWRLTLRALRRHPLFRPHLQGKLAAAPGLCLKLLCGQTAQAGVQPLHSAPAGWLCGPAAFLPTAGWRRSRGIRAATAHAATLTAGRCQAPRCSPTLPGPVLLPVVLCLQWREAKAAYLNARGVDQAARQKQLKQLDP